MKINSDSKTTEKMIRDGGYHQLTSDELLTRIIDKTIRGDYFNGRKFNGIFYKDGTTEGKNDLGTHLFGEWSINTQDNSLEVIWDGYWFNTLTNMYEVDGEIKFYDCETGKWRMTFIRFTDGKKSLDFVD